MPEHVVGSGVRAGREKTNVEEAQAVVAIMKALTERPDIRSRRRLSDPAITFVLDPIFPEAMMTAATHDVQPGQYEIAVGRFLNVQFQRTIRLPNDDRDHPLPPGLGRFPLRRVSDFACSVPPEWLRTGGFLLPAYRHEALWLSFRGELWHPVAVRVEAGGVCALTGECHAPSLHDDPQNYFVVPGQPWLDGIKAGDGIIRQFVAAPLGEGATIEAQVAGSESVGGIQITVVEPVRGRFPDELPRYDHPWRIPGEAAALDDEGFEICAAAPPMGLGVGGRMIQKIYPDEYGLDTWDTSTATTIHIHLVDARDWRRITGEAPPPSPITIETYREYGLPWFALDDADRADLSVSPVLSKVKPVSFF